MKEMKEMKEMKNERNERNETNKKKHCNEDKSRYNRCTLEQMPHVPDNCHQLLTHPTRTPLASLGSVLGGSYQAHRREMNPKRLAKLTKIIAIATGPIWKVNWLRICLGSYFWGGNYLAQAASFTTWFWHSHPMAPSYHAFVPGS